MMSTRPRVLSLPDGYQLMDAAQVVQGLKGVQIGQVSSSQQNSVTDNGANLSAIADTNWCHSNAREPSATARSNS
jgi:hypothetical protein